MPPELEAELENTEDRGDDFVSDEIDAEETDGEEVEAKADEVEAKADEAEEADEAEGEETEAEAAERAAAEAAEDKNKRIRIPKARFDEAVNKARQREEALNQRIAELESTKNVATKRADVAAAQAKVEELNDQYEDLILDGDRDGARAVRKKAAQLQAQLNEYNINERSEQARKSAIDDLKYESALSNVEASYEALNPDSESFDGEKTDEVAMLMEAFLTKGFTRNAALDKAVKYVMGAATAAADGAVTAVKTDKRALEARTRASKAAALQPASTTNVGLNSDKAGKTGGIDVMRMSQSAFAKLDEATLSKMRGDSV